MDDIRLGEVRAPAFRSVEGRLVDRLNTRRVMVGTIPMGGGAPVTVQSMTNTDTEDVASSVAQIRRLEAAGCEVVRLAVPNEEAAVAVGEIKEKVSAPIVADVHFDYKLAVISAENGADKLRINPGNIGSKRNIAEVVKAARSRGIPIRIGVNSGSLEKDLLSKYGGPRPEALVDSAFRNISYLEDLGFSDIVVSLKASDVPTAIEAYLMAAEKMAYPLHVGITESGTIRSGTIRSSAGIGAILSRGIGDTIRVSLTADPVEEVYVGFEILRSLGLRERGPFVISCPSCGRTQIDVIYIAEEVERRISRFAGSVKVAVMGCAVNGPGEAKDADVGIAGGKKSAVLFRKGEIVRKIDESDAVEVLVKEVKNLCGIG